MEKQTVSVRVPATAGNFCGVADCGALALDATLNVKITRCLDGGVRIRYFGENGERVPRDSSDLVVRAIEAALQYKQREFTGADFEIYSSVPVAVGLGSSAAGVLAGLVGANSLYRLGLDEKTLFDLAAIYEFRRGNLRAAWLGGFVACGEDASGPDRAARSPFIYQRTGVPDRLMLSVVVPETTLIAGARPGQSNPAASPGGGPVRPFRRASDQTLDRDSSSSRLPGIFVDTVVTRHLNRAAALAEFFSQPGNGSRVEFEASLPPTCEKNVAGLDEALEVRTPGLLSVFVCGSGPAVGVFAAENSTEAVRAVRDAFSRHQVKSTCFEFRASNAGTLDWNAIQHDFTVPSARGLPYSLPKSNSLPV